MPPKRKRASPEGASDAPEPAAKKAAEKPCQVCGACEAMCGYVTCAGKYDKKTKKYGCGADVKRVNTRPAEGQPLNFVCDDCHEKYETCTICLNCGDAYCETCMKEDPEAAEGKSSNDGLCTRWNCASCARSVAGISAAASSSAPAAPSPAPSPAPAPAAGSPKVASEEEQKRDMYKCPCCSEIANGPVEFKCGCKRSPVYCISCVRRSLSTSLTTCSHCRVDLRAQMSKATIDQRLVQCIRGLLGVTPLQVARRRASSPPKEKKGEEKKKGGEKKKGKGKGKAKDDEEEEEDEEKEEGADGDEEEEEEEEEGASRRKGGLANAKAPPRRTPLPKDHHGPIDRTDPEQLPELNGGPIPVGREWHDRREAFADGIHGEMVSGITGGKKTPSMSICMSGGYEDDVDHGDEFYYTGSGGRELKEGNKRTADQTSDQTFDARFNGALRDACTHGVPVRVIRGFDKTKSKRRDEADIETSAYIPKLPADDWKRVFRYDGVYRVMACWRERSRKTGFMVCRFLFKRMDNDVAPWETRKTMEEGADDWFKTGLPVPPKDANEFCDLSEYKRPHEVYGGDWGRLPDGTFGFRAPPLPVDHPKRVALRKAGNKPNGPRREPRPQLTQAEKDELKSLTCSYCERMVASPVVPPCKCLCCLPCFKLCVGFGRASKKEVKKLAAGDVPLCAPVLAAYPTAAQGDACPCAHETCALYWKKKRTANPAGGGASGGGRAQRSAAQKLPCPKCGGDVKAIAADAYDPAKAEEVLDHRTRQHLELTRETLERRIREVAEAEKAWEERRRAEKEQGAEGAEGGGEGEGEAAGPSAGPAEDE